MTYTVCCTYATTATAGMITSYDYAAGLSQATTGCSQNVVWYPQQITWQQFQTAQTITEQESWNNFHLSFQETPEQRTAREQRAAEYESKVSTAAKRAEELLFVFLTAEQRSRYDKDGCFETLVNDRCYRIRKGNAMNVDLMENGKAKFKYCVLPDNNPPSPDVMLAQLLLLQNDEAKFLATANRTVL